MPPVNFILLVHKRQLFPLSILYNCLPEDEGWGIYMTQTGSNHEAGGSSYGVYPLSTTAGLRQQFYSVLFIRIV
ncbi:MAG: hypothetical protein ACXVBH_13880 [Flavisolibacter sp.]